MADSKLPYVTGYGNITKALDGIRRAATPDRFTQDFLASKLGLKGGTPKPVIPFLKRTGFLASDGSPTDRYKQFRNDSSKGMAAAEALREGFNPLFQIDENVHKATDDELCCRQDWMRTDRHHSPRTLRRICMLTRSDAG